MLRGPKTFDNPAAGESIIFGEPGADLPAGHATLMVPIIYAIAGEWVTQGGISPSQLRLRIVDRYLVHQIEKGETYTQSYLQGAEHFYGPSSNVRLAVVYVLEGTPFKVRNRKYGQMGFTA